MSNDPVKFPSEEWLERFKNKLNNDEQYARIARNWEGDICIEVKSNSAIENSFIYYLDLWHGKCRKVESLQEIGNLEPAFVLTATFENITKILIGELDPMQAMMTRRLHVKGSMAYMMRNIPTVLDFVRCAREIPTEIS